MRFVAYHKINLCLRVAGIAHPEHALLAKEGGGSQQFLCNDMFSDVSVPQFIAVGGEKKFFLHARHIIDEAGVEPQ